MFIKQKANQIAIIICALLALFILNGLSVQAIQGVSQGYSTSDEGLIVGMAATLSQDIESDERIIERSNRSNIDNFVGIVTTLDRSLVTLSGEDDNVLVVNYGEVQAYISDINGEVSVGDRLTVSPIAGLLMKASSGEQFIAGTVSDDVVINEFTEQVLDNNQQERSTTITKQVVNLNPTHHYLETDDEDQPFLELLGESITGQPVNQLQVIAALTVLILVLVIEGSIIYGAIHGSISSIGRNPLAKKAIYKQLLQVLWLTLLVLVFGLGTIYIILWA